MENKIVLLLSPQRMLTDHVVLESLHIQKNGASMDFIVNDLENIEIRRFHPNIPSEARGILTSFRKQAIEEKSVAIKKRHKLQRAGVTIDNYHRNAILRELHESFNKFRRYGNTARWYHKIQQGEGKYKTGPCYFSDINPRLEFEVINSGEGLRLQVHVFLNVVSFIVESFNRHYFLLEKSNEYFLLRYKDFQTLEWLSENDPIQFAGEPHLLAQNILAKLETDYPVNRNGLFSQNIIDRVPVNRVLLSEISGSFLVLTPQWLYESFLVEGEWNATHEVVKAGEAYLIRRNKEAETAFKTLLENLHPNFVKQLNGYYYLPFAEAQKKQWFLKVYHQLLELDIQVVGMDMLNHFRYSPDKVNTKISFSEKEDNTLNLKLAVSFGKEQIQLAELQKMLIAGQRAILLKDGSLGILGEDWLKQYATIIKHGKISGKEIKVSKWMALNEEEATIENAVLKHVFKKDWWERWKRWQDPESSLYEVPEQVKMELRPYQKKGYEWMRLLSEAGAGACLADDMGLGKTLQTICFITHLAEKNPVQKHLVICPSSLIYNWLGELQKFAPLLKAAIYHGPQRNFDLVATGEEQVILTTYGTLRSDIEKLASIQFGVAVIDESHNIKNPSALITRAVNQVQAINRVALSGTPVMNNTFDLYAQLSFLLPGMFGSREFFKNEYADAIDRNHDKDKIQALQKLTAPFILRRTKDQVATDLPEKTESILWCEMGADQMSAYESIREKVKNNIFLDIKTKGLNSGKLSVINGLLKLRQVCNSCELVKDEDLFTYDSIKTDILIEELQNIITGHKALVFSQFTSMLDLLEKSFKKHNIPYTRLDGNTPTIMRQVLVDKFQDPGSLEKVFLVSLKAGNAGLNLTAADYVFLFDPWWNTAVQQQAIDRTHRIGQTKNVFAYKMICKDTIEEKIIRLQEQKKQLAEDLIGGEEGFVKALNESDIEFLFS